MNPDFTSEDSKAACLEGWDVYDCDGSDNGRWQIQCIDMPECVGPDVPDAVAWEIVMNGTQPHHERAREFIKAHNPQEWEAMNEHMDKKKCQ